MPAAVTPPPAPSTPSPVGASPSVRRVARHPRHCAPTSVAPAVPPSHPLTSPWSSTPPLTPFPTSVFPPTTSTAAASGQVGPRPYCVVRSTPTPSTSLAAGNRTQFPVPARPGSPPHPRPGRDHADTWQLHTTAWDRRAFPRRPDTGRPLTSCCPHCHFAAAVPIATSRPAHISHPPTRVGGPPMAL